MIRRNTSPLSREEEGRTLALQPTSDGTFKPEGALQELRHHSTGQMAMRERQSHILAHSQGHLPKLPSEDPTAAVRNAKRDLDNALAIEAFICRQIYHYPHIADNQKGIPTKSAIHS